MTQRKPLTPHLVSYVLGNDPKALYMIHNGLKEVSLKGLRDVWNLEEMFVFSYEQYSLRTYLSKLEYWQKYRSQPIAQDWLHSTRSKLVSLDFYDLSNKFFSKGMKNIRILKKKNKKNFSLEREYKLYNPYGQKKNLKERIAKVHPLVITDIRNSLSQPVCVYVRTDQKEYALAAQKTDPRPIVIMDYLPPFAQKDSVQSRFIFAKRIAEELNSYF